MKQRRGGARTNERAGLAQKGRCLPPHTQYPPMQQDKPPCVGRLHRGRCSGPIDPPEHRVGQAPAAACAASVRRSQRSLRGRHAPAARTGCTPVRHGWLATGHARARCRGTARPLLSRQTSTQPVAIGKREPGGICRYVAGSGSRSRTCRRRKKSACLPARAGTRAPRGFTARCATRPACRSGATDPTLTL
jgi:hypothetical protein